MNKLALCDSITKQVESFKNYAINGPRKIVNNATNFETIALRCPKPFQVDGTTYSKVSIRDSGDLKFNSPVITYSDDVDAFVANVEGLGYVWRRQVDCGTFAVTWDNVVYCDQQGYNGSQAKLLFQIVTILTSELVSMCVLL